MRKIIFVCHGNICRSVAAEFIMKSMLKDEQIEVISRATSTEEIGNDIYPPMKWALNRHDIPFETHKAKQITQDDYDWADEIYYMDHNNLYYLNHLLKDDRKIIHPISIYTPSIGDIEDPWYSGEYDIVIREITECIKDLIINCLNSR